ncbi:hypothetical protein DZF91_30175 [Actinomadura logoneensis]|uniref:Uncharacterized protein n=1 Tax=Actinomadura logoneensis TaxID=2293572 RepID=A0A372JF02_9ACTN|nr:hypothetical protein [Actinomadura logoneensis]RFU37958.1 hypothetical protein DZF91_30175 [Actinomadura logoneensis]
MTTTHGLSEIIVGEALERRSPAQGRTYLSGAGPTPGVPLPPVLIAPVDELVAAVRECEMYRMVTAHIGWASRGRPLVGDGEPVPDDVLALVRERLPDSAPRGEALRHAARVFWDVLVRADILHPDEAEGVLRPGATALALTGPDDEAALAAWHRTVIALLDEWGGVGPGDGPRRQGLTANLLVSIYTYDQPIPRTSITPWLGEDGQVAMGHHLDALYECGLIAYESARVGITPLGRSVTRVLLEDATGIRVPVVGDHADGDAAELMAALPFYPGFMVEPEVRMWLARGGRTVDVGAAEFAAALRDASPGARRAGLDILAGKYGAAFGEEGRRALAALADDPALAGLVRNRLTDAERDALPRPAPSGSDAWALIDMVAEGMESGLHTPHAIITELGYTGWPGEKFARLLGLFAESDHPWAERVLTLMAEHHPEPSSAAAARALLDRPDPALS